VATVAGVVAVVGLALAGLAWARSGTLTPVRVGLLTYAAANFVVPVVARALTASDVSSRVMSPMLVPIVSVAAFAADALAGATARGGWARVLVPAAVVAWAWQGVAMARDVPDLASSGDRSLYSPGLYAAVDALPADAQLLTNNPWGLWWQNRREPTLFAFTRPRAGNSHFPIAGDRLVAIACASPTYLAWFSTLLNAGDGPAERRPDLLELVRLDPLLVVPGGTLSRVVLRDPASCPVGFSAR
jgi:hypothetical protein